MQELNDVKIQQLPSVLKRESLMESYYGLIQCAEENCKRLCEEGIEKASDIFRMISDTKQLELLCIKTGISKNYIQMLAGILSFNRFKPISLKKLDNIEEAYLNAFTTIRIKNTGDLLLACNNRSNREGLSRKLAISTNYIEKIVKIADLMRLPGVKNTRVTLYLEAGIDCIEKIAKQNSNDMRNFLIQYITKEKSSKMAPLPKELETQVAWSKLYPIVIEV